MARYIDSEQVVRELLSLSVTDGLYGRGLSRGIELALSIVNRQDTADVVEVVRCKDCDIIHNKWMGCPRLNGLIPPPMFYCALGERRTDNDL